MPAPIPHPFPMKIGLVTGEFPPMEGGVGAFTRELARALAAAGHEMHVLTHRDARPAPPPGERYGYSRLREPFSVPFGQLHPRAGRWGWADAGLIPDLVLRYELDVLNIQYQAAAYNMRSPALNLAPWRLKGLVPTVVTFHDLRVPYLFPKAGRLRRMAVEFMARQAAGVIVTNRQDYRELQRLGIGDGRLEEIPIGSNIGVHEVAPEEVLVARRQLGVRPVDCLLGYFGFLNESKGADTLVRALARLDGNFQLVFVGGRTGASDSANNQAFLERLDSLIKELGLEARVHWTGFLSDEEVSLHLNAADLMVLPYRDGISLRRGTLMAALAHGRPVLSTEPAGPTPPLAHGDNVWLVPRDDEVALAEAIRHLGARPDLRERLGRGAAAIAPHFTWERIAAQSAAFYRQLMVDG